MASDHQQEETEATEEASQSAELLEEPEDDDMVDSSIYNDIISSLNIVSNGRHVALQNPDVRVRIEHFFNYLSSLRVPEAASE